MARQRQDLNYLVVDDFSTMRRIVQGLLNDVGCHKVDNDPADGNEALAKLRARPYDFVITDINMPNKNGFELLKEMKADPALKHIPVLMVTAEARKEDIVLAAQCGAAGYIVKPFTSHTLGEKIDKVLAKLDAEPDASATARVSTPASGQATWMLELAKSPQVVTFNEMGGSEGHSGIRCRTGHFITPDEKVFCAVMPEDQSRQNLVSLAFTVAQTYPAAYNPQLATFRQRTALAFQLPSKASQAQPPEFRQRVQTPNGFNPGWR